MCKEDANILADAVDTFINVYNVNAKDATLLALNVCGDCRRARLAGASAQDVRRTFLRSCKLHHNIYCYKK